MRILLLSFLWSSLYIGVEIYLFLDANFASSSLINLYDNFAAASSSRSPSLAALDVIVEYLDLFIGETGLSSTVYIFFSYCTSCMEALGYNLLN